MRIFSYRWRLFLAFILVIIIGIGAVVLFISNSLHTEFRVSEGKEMFERISLMQQILQKYYREHNGWAGVQSEVERMGQLYGLRVLIEENSVIASDSGKSYLGQKFDPGSPLEKRTIDSSNPATQNQPTGVIFETRLQPGGEISVQPMLFPPPKRGPLPNKWEDLRQKQINEFRNSVNWAVLWGSLIGIGLAAILTFFSSRSMTLSIRSLTNAARNMAKGDLSQRVSIKSQDEIGELAEDFNQMAEDLERTDKLRRNMVADIAHELRTPLSNIRGYVEGIHDGVVQVDAESKEYMFGEVLLLSRLIEDLHELALADSGELDLVREVVDIRDIVNNIVKSLQPQISTKGLNVRSDLPSEPAMVMADKLRIGQVLRNLLINAINYTKEKDEINISVKQELDLIEVSVTDTGIGISPENLPYVFEQFYRVDKSRSRSTGGTGLGLTIASRLIEFHGSKLKVESTFGKGSKFYFSLPVEKI